MPRLAKAAVAGLLEQGLEGSDEVDAMPDYAIEHPFRQIGSKGYQDCYKARLYERKLDYSLPPGDKPSPSLL